MAARTMHVAVERFPLAQKFVISRGAKTEAVMVMVTLHEAGHRGRGECVPYARYGETVETVTQVIESTRVAIEQGADRAALQLLLPAGAARNAIDCALWDLEAKRAGKRAFALAGLPPPGPVTTAYTISLGTPQEMAESARRAATRPLLKVKLGGPGDPGRIAAVRGAAPEARLIVDANEAWQTADLASNFAACLEAGVSLIEQPFPEGQDQILADIERPVPVCADESVHDRTRLASLRERYDSINIKLDKTGGLTEALALAAEAERLGFKLFIGCMVATSLSMAPALLLAGRAQFVDLDGPLLLARDRPVGLHYDGSIVYPPEAELWG